MLALCALLYDVNPEKICNFFTKSVTAAKVLMVSELFFAHFAWDTWLTLVTSFKQI
jgi:hypothetical protein